MRALIDILNDEKRLMDEGEALRIGIAQCTSNDEMRILTAGRDAIINQLDKVRDELRDYLAQLNK